MTQKSLFPIIRRVEDPDLLAGRSCFIHDIRLPDMLYARMVRSPHAHARLGNVRLNGAPPTGALAFLNAGDINRVTGTLPVRGQVGPNLSAESAWQRDTLLEPLAEHEVVYAGQPYAVVLAGDPYLAEDAAERVQADFEILPVLDSVATSLKGEIKLYSGWDDNIAARVALATGDARQAIRQAEFVVREVFHSHRCAASPLETRGVVADYRPETGEMTVWSSTQTPQSLQRTLAAFLPLPPEKIIVHVPGLGGAFGCKCAVYPEELIVPYLAYHCGRPVAWHEDRAEHFTSTSHAREQIHHITLAAGRDGRFLALQDEFFLDGGAWNPTGIIQPYNTASHLAGPYVFPNIDVRGSFVLTHKSPSMPYRGAGRPEAVFALERAINILAGKLGADPAELRERNMIEDAEQAYPVGFKYRDGQPVEIDSRRFRESINSIRQAMDEAGLRERQRALRKSGSSKRIGVGWAAYIEGTGIGPYEGISLAIDGEGCVQVRMATSSHGQGHRTMLTQICAAVLDIDPARISVVTGEAEAVTRSIGTMASRVAVLAGNAAWQAAGELIERSKEAAADLLEIDVRDLVYSQGTVYPVGAPDRAVTFGQLVQGGASLKCESAFTPPTVTFGGGVHAALVEVDLETGSIRTLRYWVAHDGGLPVHEQLVDGQIVGGVAQGIGQALLEELVYDAHGQLLTRSYMDYLLPAAGDIPPIEIEHLPVISKRNPLGLKGVGEAGSICPPAVIANAVEDALEGRWQPRTTPLGPAWIG